MSKTIDEENDECRIECENCGQLCDEERIIPNSELCDECGVVCEACEEVVLMDDSIYIEESNEVLCCDCVIKCHNCHTYINPRGRNTHTWEQEAWCDNCWSDMYICNSCGVPMYSEEMYHCEHCEECYCESCWDDCHQNCGEPSVHDIDWIYSADYRPEPVFYPDYKEGTLYHGVELEVDGADDIEDLCTSLDKMGNQENLFYLKTDGSLSNKGVEIVTHPMTIKEHKDTMPWTGMCELLNRGADEGSTNACCGIHVHSSLEYFTHDLGTPTTRRKYIAIDLALYKLTYLIDKHWENFKKFSRRSATGYCIRPCVVTKTTRRAIDDHKKTGKYMAIQISDNTFETRLWAGTLQYNWIMASIEMTNGLMRYVKETTVKDIKLANWGRLMEDVLTYDEPMYLKDCLIERSLLCA